MTTPPPPLPTDAELGLLRILWGRGPSTVREVLESLPPEREVGYTTVLKLLQIMHEKGIVTRDASSRSHIYEPVLEQEATEERLLDDFLQRGFAGSSARLALRALTREPPSSEELDELRRLVGELGEDR